MEEGDPPNEKSVTLNVKFIKQSIKAEIFLFSTVQDLKYLLKPITNLLPCCQKLITKGRILRDGMTLMEAGLNHGDKLMLLPNQGLQEWDDLIREEAQMRKTEYPVHSVLNSDIEQWNATGIIQLSYCHLMAFPDEIWTHGSSARVLDVSYNSLKEVPYELGLLNMLQKLNFTGNLIPNDPILWQGLAPLKSLAVLSLKQNQLTSLPSEIGLLESLVQLDISCNRLTRFPDEIGQLTRLELLKASNNWIGYIPPSIWNCISLVEVDLSFNLLTELPATFGELTELEALYLCYNELKTLPRTLFRNCLQLSTLDVDGTEITDDHLSQFQGWEEFNERQVLKRHKQLDFSIADLANFNESAGRD